MQTAPHLYAQIRSLFSSFVASVVFLLLNLVSMSFGQATLVDSSFAVGGGADGPIHGFLIQSNGSILVGGGFQTIAGQSHSNLARLNGDGSYDDSMTTGTDREVYRLLQQPDGKILVAGGFTNLQGAVRKRIGRLLTNCQVDPGFDAGPLLETNRLAITLGLQPDGKVLVATLAEKFGEGDAGGLVRLQTNGVSDESFVQTNLFMDRYIFAIHVRSNGTILVGGGFSSAGGHASPGLALLQPDGRPDTNFNAQLDNLSTVFSIVEQTNGNLIIGGIFRRVGETNDTVLGRLTPSLEWDPGFTSDQFKPQVGDFALIRSVVEQPDGKLLVAGSFSTVGGYWRQHVARLNLQGHVAPCFDPGLGLTSTSLGAVTLARQDNGRVLIGGYFDSVDGSNCANLARLLPQSDCDAIRIHLGQISGGGYHYVAGTSPPGGELYVQSSTNLVDWIDDFGLGGAFLIYYLSPPLKPAVFFRARKTY